MSNGTAAGELGLLAGMLGPTGPSGLPDLTGLVGGDGLVGPNRLLGITILRLRMLSTYP